MNVEKLYLCNPDKNYTCKKSHCRHSLDGGECQYTTNKEYSYNLTSGIISIGPFYYDNIPQYFTKKLTLKNRIKIWIMQKVLNWTIE